MKLFLIGGMEDLNFNYCYKITYESGETYDRRRNELSVEISKEDYKKIITGVLQQCGQLKPRMLKIQRFWAYILDFFI